MHRFSVYFSHVLDSLPHGEFPCSVRMDKLIAQPLCIVKVMQAVYESLVLHIIGTFRYKSPPFTHKPQIIVKRSPRLFLPLIVCPASGYALVIFRHFRRRGSLSDGDMQTVVNMTGLISLARYISTCAPMYACNGSRITSFAWVCAIAASRRLSDMEVLRSLSFITMIREQSAPALRSLGFTVSESPSSAV